MVFPSYIFLLVLLPLSLWLWWWWRPFTQARLQMLTLASYVFYGWWDWRYVSLMFGSTLLDYLVGRAISRTDDPRRRKLWLLVSMVGNLGVLAVFKYLDFFMASAMTALGWLGIEADWTLLHLVLPLGISFYTFQSMSYTIDIYRGTCRPARSLLHFSAYVSMFPQLVAGPIVRYSDVEDQVEQLSPQRRLIPEQFAEGLWLFMIGIAKKVWIADRLAPMAEALFDGAGTPTLVVAWTGVMAYTFQLYFDFSGYSDMARGLGKLFGFDFPINFNSPYKARNIAEFWNRWHITLSSFLRDYLFIPLGGSRCSRVKQVRNLMITMFLGGLWHGAGWTFVVWGVWHGTMLGVQAVWKGMGRRMAPLPAQALTFACVVFGWILFRSPSMARVGEVCSGLSGGGGTGAAAWTGGTFEIGMLLVAAALAFRAPNSQEIAKPQGFWWGVLLAAALLGTLVTLMQETPFLYFQF